MLRSYGSTLAVSVMALPLTVQAAVAAATGTVSSFGSDKYGPLGASRASSPIAGARDQPRDVDRAQHIVVLGAVANLPSPASP
jgi:hypothetical protein